ncbi:hypothetical protein GCM10027020_17330 [Nocardioides salsibiostraticola]
MRGIEVTFWIAFVVLIVPAGTLTVVRVVEPESGRALQIEAFTPYALPLYALALILLAGTAVRRSESNAPFLVPAVLVVVGLGAHFYWLSPQFLGATPEPADDAPLVRVMTANLLAGEADTVALVELVRDQDVDLLVVNEVTDRSVRDMVRVGLTALLPFQAGTPGEGVEGTMVFSRKPLTDVKSIDTEFDSLVATTQDLVVIAVHPRPPGDPVGWRADHDAVYAAVGEYDPDLILGDFNATPDHPPMRRLSDNGYRDSVEITNGIIAPTWPTNGGYPILGWLPATAPIDHVLVSSDIAVVETGTADLPSSDHRPVIAVIARR